jgi:hypothetical protein
MFNAWPAANPKVAEKLVGVSLLLVRYSGFENETAFVKASFKFLKMRNRIPAVAAISVESVSSPSSDSLKILWPDDLVFYEKFYAQTVRDGVQLAVHWHGSGNNWIFKILTFTEFPADTLPDAVRCASAMAAWKALGHAEEELTFEFDGEWKVKKTD